jgi:hypothetical protein
MSYEIVGKLVAKYDIIQRSETFKTREFVIEKSDEISGRTIVNYAKFQCVQDKTTIIDKVNIGDNVKVYFNIKGSQWNKDGKVNYITNLDAWRIEQILAGESKASAGPSLPPFEQPMDNFGNDSDALPF